MRRIAVLILVGAVCVGAPGRGLAQEGAMAPVIIRYAGYALEMAVAAVHTYDLWTWINDFLGRKSALTPDEEVALGVKYLTGEDKRVKVNKQEAYTHFVRASKAGNLYAKIGIAVMYMHGDMAEIESREIGDQDWNLAGQLLLPLIRQTGNPLAEYDYAFGAEHFGLLDVAIAYYNGAKVQGYPAATNAVSRLCRDATFSLGLIRLYDRAPTGPIIREESWNTYCQSG